MLTVSGLIETKPCIFAYVASHLLRIGGNHFTYITFSTSSAMAKYVSCTTTAFARKDGEAVYTLTPLRRDVLVLAPHIDSIMPPNLRCVTALRWVLQLQAHPQRSWLQSPPSIVFNLVICFYYLLTCPPQGATHSTGYFTEENARVHSILRKRNTKKK